jgi:hypothetical protein
MTNLTNPRARRWRSATTAGASFLVVALAATSPAVASQPRAIGWRSLRGGQHVITLGRSTFSGPIGSTISAGAGTASITTPNLKALPIHSESAVDVYEDALAAGMPHPAALQMLAEAREDLSLRNDPILASGCASTSGGGASGTACVIQTGIQTPASGNWYLGDQITATGTSSSKYDFSWLTWMSGWTTYGSGNTEVSWNPTGYEPQSNCGTMTASVDFGGISLSQPLDVCPDGFGPTSGLNGGRWTGCSYTAEGAPAVNVEHSPPDASAAVTISVKIEWAGCGG